jgi:hypothetical protein
MKFLSALNVPKKFRADGVFDYILPPWGFSMAGVPKLVPYGRLEQGIQAERFSKTAATVTLMAINKQSQRR